MYFNYYSETQKIVHLNTFLILLGITFWTVEANYKSAAALFVLFAFGWLIAANEIINSAIKRNGTKFGIFDFSKNITPTKTEKVLIKLIWIISIACGGSASIIFANLSRRGLGSAIFFGGAALFLCTSAVFSLLTYMVIILSGFNVRPVRD